jgi:hypothetical protein
MPSLWLIVALPISRRSSSRRRLVVVVLLLSSSCRRRLVVVVVIIVSTSSSRRRLIVGCLFVNSRLVVDCRFFVRRRLPGASASHSPAPLVHRRLRCERR